MPRAIPLFGEGLHVFLGRLLRGLPPIRGLHRRFQRWWIARRTKPCAAGSLTPNGLFIICDLSVPYESMVWLGLEEQEDILVLRRLLKPGQTFIDVGANIGLWTLESAALAGPSGHVHAFEPNPTTMAKLQTNVVLNGFANRASLHECAVSDRNGQAYFHKTQEHNISHLVLDGSVSTILVRTITLDSKLASLSHLHGIKIDVEGHELGVLKGAAELLRRYHPWIVVEFNGDLTPTPLGKWPVHRFLAEMGYSAEPMPSCRAAGLADDYRPPGYANVLYRWGQILP